MKIFAVVIALFLIAGGFSYYVFDLQQYYSSVIAKQDSLRKEKEGAPSKEQKYQGVVKAYNLILDQFLSNAKTRAENFKDKRYVIRDMVRPASLRDDTYIDQNLEMAEDVFVELQKDIDEFMAAFGSTESKLLELSQDLPADKKEVMMSKWSALKKEYSDLYTAYFLIEMDILNAHKQMLEFYQLHKGQFEVDLENDRVFFADAELQVGQSQLKEKIRNLQKDQSKIFKEYFQN